MSSHPHVGRTNPESRPLFDEGRQSPAGAPNVVMILLDDLGFAEFGCYGSASSTPNVDALAEQGLRYNSFHVTAMCSPTRTCLLTGRNQHAVGMGFFPDVPMGFPGYSGRIPKSAGALPRLLRDGGYSTLAVGKWHLTPRYEHTAAGPFDRWPLGMGFERYYGFLGGMTNQWDPDLTCDNGLIAAPQSPEENYHVTEDLASKAISFVQDQQQAAPDKPFFLYFATGATHQPHQVPAAWVEYYRNRFDEGWEALRRETFLRQLELGVVPLRTTLTQRPPWVAAWDELSSDERRVSVRQMEVYAAFLTHTDAQIGRLIDFLARIDVLDNTIIMVLSDNGASAEGGPHGFLAPGAHDVESMAQRIDDFGGQRALNHYAWGWAWAGNTPFKLWKRYSWLGGVRVPLIVRWPRGIASDHNGQVRNQFCHAIDLMPTILAAAGAEVPETLDGVSQQPVQGASILPTFADSNAPSPRSTQYFETVGSRAIYHEGWKATTDYIDNVIPAERELIPGSHDFDADRWSLFCLDEDFAEVHDLAEAQPERLRQMIELWSHEASSNQVLPLLDGAHAFGETLLEPPPYSARQEYVCLPGGGPIITRSFLAGFRLIADIEVIEGRDLSGVIAAHHNYRARGGTSPGGWACFVQDGRLTISFDADGAEQHVVASDARLTGRHEVEIAYRAEPEADDSMIHVAVDGREVASLGASIEALARRAHLFEGKLLIGRDQGLPVSDVYRPPFPFTGQIHRVIYTAPPSQPSDIYKEIESVQRDD